MFIKCKDNENYMKLNTKYTIVITDAIVFFSFSHASVSFSFFVFERNKTAMFGFTQKT